MGTVILVIHLIIAIALVAIILLQRSEGGALSGLGGGSFGGLMSGRGTANLLTRTTAILATCFIGTSLVLAILAGNSRSTGSILDAPVQGGEVGVPDEPAEPAGPSAPVAN